jgi:hypothetical protein
LFRSWDGGQTWEEVLSLTTHPTREKWFPSAGGLILHSIVLNPTNGDLMWTAISAAGVFGTDDGGESWLPMNDSLRNVMPKYVSEPEMYPETGQCVHHLVHAAGREPRLYAQTHWGTYRSRGRRSRRVHPRIMALQWRYTPVIRILHTSFSSSVAVPLSSRGQATGVPDAGCR